MVVAGEPISVGVHSLRSLDLVLVRCLARDGLLAVPADDLTRLLGRPAQRWEPVVDEAVRAVLVTP